MLLTHEGSVVTPGTPDLKPSFRSGIRVKSMPPVSDRHLFTALFFACCASSLSLIAVSKPSYPSCPIPKNRAPGSQIPRSSYVFYVSALWPSVPLWPLCKY
jgi:hypothetical protein